MDISVSSIMMAFALAVASNYGKALSEKSIELAKRVARRTMSLLRKDKNIQGTKEGAIKRLEAQLIESTLAQNDALSLSLTESELRELLKHARQEALDELLKMKSVDGLDSALNDHAKELAKQVDEPSLSYREILDLMNRTMRGAKPDTGSPFLEIAERLGKTRDGKSGVIISAAGNMHLEDSPIAGRDLYLGATRKKRTSKSA